MGISLVAAHFDALHTVGSVFDVLQKMGIDGLGECGPSTTGVEFVGGEEEGFSCCDVYIDARTKLVVVFIGEGTFGGSVLRDLILDFGELRFERICGGTLIFTLRGVGIGFTSFGKEGESNVAISSRILVQIVLVIILSCIEIAQRFDFYCHIFTDSLCQLGALGNEEGTSVGIGVVDASAILCADVATLAIDAGGVDATEIELHEKGEGKNLRIISYFHSFGKTSGFGAYLFVGGMLDVAIGIAHFGGENATDLLEIVLGAPETATSEIESCSLVHSLRRICVRRGGIVAATSDTTNCYQQKEQSTKRIFHKSVLCYVIKPQSVIRPL